MIQQIIYDTATGEIMQWQDTALFGYAPPPANAALLTVTASEWANRAGNFYVAAGVITPGSAPIVLSPAQQATALISGGITITSTGTPALDGVYACDATAQSNLQAVQTYILTNGKFPGSSGTYPWLDTSGAAHIFPSITEFEAFASRVADFVADCTLIMLTNSGTLPPASATIP